MVYWVLNIGWIFHSAYFIHGLRVINWIGIVISFLLSLQMSLKKKHVFCHYIHQTQQKSYSSVKTDIIPALAQILVQLNESVHY